MNTQSLLADAEKMDARVCVRHERYANETVNGFPVIGTAGELASLGLTPSGKGGETLVMLVDRFGEYEPILGVARCRRDENFNKKLGLRIALGRALKKAFDHGGVGRERYISKIEQVVLGAIAEVFPPQTEVMVFDFIEPGTVPFVEYPEAEAAREVSAQGYARA